MDQKINLIADVLTKIWTLKVVVTQMSKKSRFRRHYSKQHGKRFQTLLQYARQQCYHIYWSVLKKLTWKHSLLVICNILGLFVSIMTADDKYFLLNRDNSTQSIQMQLSRKQKTFSDLFFQVFKSRLNFEHFRAKINLIADVLMKFQTLKVVIIQMSKNSCFRGPYNKQTGKRSQILWKYVRQYIY